MRWRVYLIGVLAWIVTVPLPLARAQGSLQERYLNIYLKINTAENLEKQGDYRGALEDFKDCYAKLERIHEQNPDWEKALVGHRLEDCKAKILDLQPKADAQAPATPASAVTNVPPVQPPVVAPSDSDLVDVPSLKKRLREVEVELQTTKQNLSDSQNQVEAYRSQLEVVNQQLAGLKNQQSVNDKVGRLLSENKALTDKLAAAQKEIDTFKSANPKSKLSLVQAQLKNLQDQFDASQTANKTLQQTTDTLKQKLDEVQADLVTANQKLAAAPAASPEYQTLKHENEIMRDILTRELQEQAHRDMAKRLAQEEFDNLKLKSKVLQEQIDILGSPMTPPTNDQERDLLASLKGPGMDVTQPPPASGNVLSAPAAGTPPSVAVADATPNAVPQAPAIPSTPDTNMASATSPATNSAPATNVAANPPSPAVPGPADNSTNPPPVTVASNNPATNAAPDAAGTNSLASTPTPPPPTTPDSGASMTPPATATPDAGSVSQPSTPPAVTAPPTDTTATPPPAPSASDAGSPTKSVIPPGTTTYTDTTIKNGATAPQQNDPTQYSTKARLPDDMRDTAQQAADLFKNQRYDESAAKYQSIIDKYPESLYAWSNLGVVRFQQGNLNDALKALQQAVKLSPTDAFSYANLGIVYYQLNQYENAIDALNAAKALDPNDAKTRNYLGCACSQKGWQEVAEKEFRKAIEIDPNFGDAHFNLSLVYATSKPPSLELARREYNRALELGIAKDARLEKLLQPKP